jgi:hypothetical protein
LDISLTNPVQGGGEKKHAHPAFQAAAGAHKKQKRDKSSNTHTSFPSISGGCKSQRVNHEAKTSRKKKEEKIIIKKRKRAHQPSRHQRRV